MARRELPGGYELDDDRGRVDVEAVYRFLSEEAYWVRGRSPPDSGAILPVRRCTARRHVTSDPMVHITRRSLRHSAKDAVGSPARCRWRLETFVVGSPRSQAPT